MAFDTRKRIVQLPPSNIERLLENFVNVPHFLLGKRLQPFCFLHLLWLNYLGSPFVVTSKTITISDIEVAACVCSSLSSEEILFKLKAKNGNLWQRTTATLWHWRNCKADLQAATLAFIAYQSDYCSLPEFAGSGSGETDEKLPYCLQWVAELVRETGWAEETVLTMPWGKVVWYCATFAYLRTNNTNVVSDKERLAIAALQQLTAETK